MCGLLLIAGTDLQTTVVVMDLDSVPLAQAAVQVDDLLVFTDASGQATLLCKGASVLKVFAEGHQSFLLDPFACNGRTWTVTLTPLEVTIGEVVVEEARETNGVQPALTMSAIDIEAVPSSTGIPDLLTSLKTTRRSVPMWKAKKALSPWGQL